MSMTAPSNGANLVTVDGRALALRATSVAVDAKGGLARVVVSQTFHNAHAEPLHVTYTLPLPLEAAVSGFSFVVNDKTIVGEVDRRAAARERFEQALVDGKSAALLEEDRSTLFRQEVGNIPPGADVRVEITLDQRLAWVHGDWEWRFPTVAAPRYLAESGRVADAQRVSQAVADQPSSPPFTLSLAIRDALPDTGRPTSPSHELRIAPGVEVTNVEFRAESEALDRDLVVRWPAAEADISMGLDTARPANGHARAAEMHGLMTLLPPRDVDSAVSMKRDVIVLIDTSGSMQGQPLVQAKKVVSAVVESLDATDCLEMIEFSDRARRWKKGAELLTEKARRSAQGWLAALEAGGATEMRTAVEEAMSSLRADAQRQVVLVSDGHIGFETEVVATVLRRLPVNSRMHAVGVGSAVNRSLLGPVSRAGRGVEVHVGLDEDAKPAAHRLVAALAQPLVVELSIEGDVLLQHAPERLPDLFAHRPATVALQLRAEGGALRIRGTSAAGEWSQSVTVPARQPGEGSRAVAALFAREAVEDLEMRGAASKDRVALQAEIERIGLEFQIATRLTTWVAVSETAAVDPRSPSRREKVPQQLPYGMSMEGLGLRRAAGFVGTSVMDSFFERSFSDQTFGAMSPRGYTSRQRKPQLLRTSASRKRQRRAQTLTARVVVQDDQSLVLEITAAAGFNWQPGRKAIVFADGRKRTIKIIETRTTRPGPVESGQLIRLALQPLQGNITRVMLKDGTRILVHST